MLQLTPLMGHVWTLLQMGFGGEGLREHFLMLGYAPTNRRLQLSSCYRSHENAYEQRIREVEHGSFVPLVLSVTGGMGRIATTTYKRLASLLSSKWNQPYSNTLGWLRCRLSFALLRASILAIRGARSSSGRVTVSASIPIDLVTLSHRFQCEHFVCLFLFFVVFCCCFLVLFCLLIVVLLCFVFS